MKLNYANIKGVKKSYWKLVMKLEVSLNLEKLHKERNSNRNECCPHADEFE